MKNNESQIKPSAEIEIMKTIPFRIIRQRSSLVLLLLTLALTGAITAQAATPPGVSNVRASQRPGTKLVDIQFDLNPVGGSNVPISILVSSNSGGIWDVPARTFTGDYGKNISLGVDKWVVWNAGADWNGQYTPNCRVRVMANDPTRGDMVLIPAGSYQRGESSQYEVYVSAFYMDCGEVTVDRWNEVYNWATNHGYELDYPGSTSTDSDYPLHETKWLDSLRWCNARSEMEGLLPCYYTDGTHTNVYRTGQPTLTNDCVKWEATGYRLPTEAEWEKAARGGLTGKRFPWGDRINQTLANYRSYYQWGTLSYDDGPAGYNVNSHPYWPRTMPVGSFAPNAYGLFDMAGNINELCWDRLDYSYFASGQIDPRGPNTTGPRVCRGGSGVSDTETQRCADRSRTAPENSVVTVGFRCVRRF